MSKETSHMQGDRVIWMVVIILSILSLLAVYSSTGTLAYKYQEGNTLYYMIKHLIILVFGFALMYLAHLVKYTYYSRIFQIALYIAIPLLIITFFFGKDVNEARRALPLPFGLTFQASDLAKLTLVMYLARILTKKQDEPQDFKSLLAPVMLPVLVICGLILPGNLSTAVMLFVTSLVLLFIGRIKMKYIFSMVGLAVGAFLVYVLVLMILPRERQGRLETWENRIESFFSGSNEEEDQVVQSKIAVASGGILGKMPGNSTNRATSAQIGAGIARQVNNNERVSSSPSHANNCWSGCSRLPLSKPPGRKQLWAAGNDSKVPPNPARAIAKMDMAKVCKDSPNSEFKSDRLS